MPIISVIVPVYKVEKYISRCIESIVNQTFVDFELLLINDGSPDCSGSICDRWAEKDKRIRVFHQKNAGVSAARNYGMNQARGKYIVFVDSDDWVLRDYLKDLYEIVCSQQGRGLIIQGAHRITVDNIHLSGILLPQRYFSFAEIGKAFIENNICEVGYPWAKIYVRSILSSHSIQFDEKINCCEDLLFMYQYLFYCDYLMLSHSQNYIYVKYASSLSTNIHSFDSEYACFMLYQQLLEKMIHTWNMPIDKLAVTIHSMMVPFQRALKSDYQTDRKIPRTIRIAHLRKLVSCNREVINKHYHPVFKTDKLGKTLLKCKLYRCYDLYISILFHFNIGPVFYGPKHIFSL